MGTYFSELRWIIIGGTSLLQFIHQVTIKIKFPKSLAQKRFKSNLEFRNQIIVLSIKFWKCFAKFMILIDIYCQFVKNLMTLICAAHIFSTLSTWTSHSCIDGAPRGFGIWGEWLFICRELGSTGYYFRGGREQAHNFGDIGSLAKKAKKNKEKPPFCSIF